MDHPPSCTRSSRGIPQCLRSVLSLADVGRQRGTQALAVSLQTRLDGLPLVRGLWILLQSATSDVPMWIGNHRPLLDPKQPAVLTFYVQFYFPVQSTQKRGSLGRAKLLSTTFSSYERQIRQQLVTLFGGAGFDPQRDIAGIVLNRWGHAYVNPQPGFYFQGDGRPAPRDVIRRPFGRIAFGHSELVGHQYWLGAINEGKRAVEQLAELTRSS